jgi:hypothetical protein
MYMLNMTITRYLTKHETFMDHVSYERFDPLRTFRIGMRYVSEQCRVWFFRAYDDDENVERVQAHEMHITSRDIRL